VGHPAAKAYHSDSQLVGGLVGGSKRVAPSQGGGGDSGGGVLQETATIEGAVFHFIIWRKPVERLSVPQSPALGQAIRRDV
tara:strand:+ start:258 stop:500 length:243 start_codon:yes stop_codon:yes gene_type:complete